MAVEDPWAESAVERTLGTLSQLNPDYPYAQSVMADGGSAGPSDPSRVRRPPCRTWWPRRSPQRADVTIDDIYRTHRMGMVRLAILLVDDQASAEDVVQEAFAGLFRNWAGLRDNAAAIGYLRTAVVNGSQVDVAAAAHGACLRAARILAPSGPPNPLRC